MSEMFFPPHLHFLRRESYTGVMSRARIALVSSIALIAFSVIMGAWHFLLAGINADFGAGAAVGFAFGAGLIFLLSRSAREL